jgi:hypothetical protein
MRKIRIALFTSLAMTAGLSSAWAQTPPPAAPPPAGTPAPATPPPAAPPPAATPAPAAPPPAAAPEAPPPAAEPTPAAPAEAAAAPAPAEEEETFPAAWFRIDSDIGGVQLWAGATHMLSDTVGIASDIYVLQNAFGSFGEFDIGPAFIAGGFTITPMLGLQVNWSAYELAALVPQLYVVGGTDQLYMELWLQNYAYTVFDKSGTSQSGGTNYIYARFFIDYKMGKYFGIGPEVELTYGLNDLAVNAVNGEKLISLPVGLNLMLSSYGKNNTLFLFGGWETQDTFNDEHVAGRLTFVHNF